jgi:hypothetical protein
VQVCDHREGDERRGQQRLPLTKHNV